MADRYYFSYHRYNGIIFCVKYHEDTPMTSFQLVGPPIEITENDFHGRLSDLEARYPYKE